MGQLPETRQHLANVFFPLLEGSGKAVAFRPGGPLAQRPGILLVLLPQGQQLVLPIELTYTALQLVLRLGKLALLLAQIHLAAVDDAVEVLQLASLLCQLLCKLAACGLLLFHPLALGFQAVFSQGCILGFCLLKKGFRILLLLGLVPKLLLQLFQGLFGVLQLVAKPQDIVVGLQICLALPAQDILVIAAVLVADYSRIPQGRLEITQRVFQGIHSLHRADHGGKVLICQHLQGFVQYLFHFRGAEGLLGKLGGAHFDEQLDELFILADITELEHPVVDQLFVRAGGFCPVAFISYQVAELLLAQGEHLPSHRFVKGDTALPDTAPIAQAKPPEINAFPPLGAHSNSYGEVLFHAVFFQL